MSWKINRSPFSFSPLLVFVITLTSVNQSLASDYEVYASSVIAYGVGVQKVEGEARGGPKKTVVEERCVFSPMFQRGSRPPGDYRGWSISPDSTKKYPLSHLQKLKSYVVLNEGGLQTDIRYQSFDLVWNSYPNYFVGSPIPKQGCGALLLIADITQPKSTGRVNSDLFLSILEKQEKELVSSAICSDAARKVVSPRNSSLDCKSILESADFSKRSSVRLMFDGSDYYLVRSYAQPRSLFMFKMDFEHSRLVPLPAFVGLGDGEQYLYLEYFMSADLDGDGVSEVIVKKNGWEWSGFGYLRKEDGYWK